MIKRFINKGKGGVNVLQELRKLKKQKTLDIEALPTVLNLNIIDSCNSKCTMCNIWRRDEQIEVTPDELREILSDPLYKELTHVGVTGGEPTLREDLVDVYSALIDALPKLKGVSIITNAIKEQEVKNRVAQIAELCKDKGVRFSAMVSIDGYADVHNQVRGTKNNFESAISVYNYFKEDLAIPTSFGSTISKINVWDIDDLLYYAQKNNMYGRFRVAETINRLYNQNRGKVIRNFDDDESYHLAIFFEKLKRKFEKNPTYKRTYSSIQEILLGGERKIGCPYHKRGIVLGSKGQINYCAPKSNDIGNGLEKSSLGLYKENFNQKQDIVKNDCKNCIHDYHAPITYEERKEELVNSFNARVLGIDHLTRALSIASSLKKAQKKSGEIYRVFILGWYGTETVGDKAILGGIVEHYKELYGHNLEVLIGSMYPFVTERTCKELNLEAAVVSTKSIDLLRFAKSSDEVVMGGGPLMDLEDLSVPYLGFKVARKYNKKTTVFGCGIGPLYNERYEKVVKEILHDSTNVLLRDQSSVEQAIQWGISDAKLSGDYAKNYLEKVVIPEMDSEIETNQVLTCFLRDWTYEYSKDLTKEQFLKTKKQLESGIASLIKDKARELNVSKVHFDHMHNFVVGNDDRDFSRYFIENYFSDDHGLDVTFNKKLSTVESIARGMKSSKHNICMRFHSVLFAQTLGVSFSAIDYTKGGKILNFLTDNDRLDTLYSVNDLLAE